MRKIMFALVLSVAGGAGYASNVVDASGYVDTSIVANNSMWYGDAIGLFAKTSPSTGNRGTAARLESSNYGVHASVYNNPGFPVNTAAFKADVTGYAYARGLDVEVTTTDYQSAHGVFAYIYDGFYSYGTEATVYGQNSWGSYVNVSSSNGAAHGYFGDVSASTGSSAYGVQVTATASSAPAYGIHATASGGTGTWAGFFNGPVYASGGFTASDEKLKKNVAPLDGGLGIIMALRPKTYEMKREEFKSHLELPAGKQYGLLAQEVEKTLPELVRPVMAPAQLTAEERKNKVEKASLEFKSVDYTALIPILIDAVQEQQAIIKGLEAKIAKLEGR